MRPIVLFGGTNGAGKTTLLDAIQLALYGTRSRCSKRNALAYDEFLRQSIHHGVCGNEGAAVAVAFRHASGGEEHVYEVNRSWSVQGRKVREELHVSLDGLPDRRHSRHWGQLVEDCFPPEVSQLFFFDAERFLLRKQSLVERIHIDPATFAITMYNRAGHALPKERLSEGEKQIFAISVLWGLARASAHPLPAIIDTPMARLDAAHRRHLVERYFRNASHQVLIRSTETEVDRHYDQALRPHIARAYHLRYDEESRATHGEEGYF
jgi:DNA repair exonuclease SbcCD ATPase subunit